MRDGRPVPLAELIARAVAVVAARQGGVDLHGRSMPRADEEVVRMLSGALA